MPGPNRSNHEAASGNSASPLAESEDGTSDDAAPIRDATDTTTARAGRPSLDWVPESELLADFPPEQLLRGLFHLLLRREPSLEGGVIEELRAGRMNARELAEWLISSDEWRAWTRMSQLGPSLHTSRGSFILMLPPARRILDLGGTALQDPQGALVRMGYPYNFDELVVVDLPSEERDPLYQEEGLQRDTVQTVRGPVTYHYRSMTDLSGYPSGSFDLVYCGQSIEHITLEQADALLPEIRRVLVPGGYFALDTPNARVTRLQAPFAFIDPDHKHEYTHSELVELLEHHGFWIRQAWGLGYAGECLRAGEFSFEEVATRRGVFAEIEDCYLLAYVCRRPRGSEGAKFAAVRLERRLRQNPRAQANELAKFAGVRLEKRLRQYPHAHEVAEPALRAAKRARHELMRRGLLPP